MIPSEREGNSRNDCGSIWLKAGGSFAKTSVRVRVSPLWATIARARARGAGVGRATHAVGHAGGFSFSFSNELVKVYSI